MTPAARDGFASGLESLGVTHVFGLPGTQNVDLFESLRGSRVRTVLATSEFAASFMAVGYARASGRPGVLATIPGPGFTYALPGLAEARLDSVPLVHLIVQRGGYPGRKFRHQEIDHRGIVAPLVKGVLEVRDQGEFLPALSAAFDLAVAGEPGPVVVWSSPSEDLVGAGVDEALDMPRSGDPGNRQALSGLYARVAKANRPMVFLGLGAMDSADPVQELVERMGAPFFTTPSARGIIPEDHPLCLGFDFDAGGLDVLNGALEDSDLVLALGCKLSHNGTGGFRLRLPETSLVHVNADPTALGANYAAGLTICGSVGDTLDALLADLPAGNPASDWSPEEIVRLRSGISQADCGFPSEPSAPGAESGEVREVIRILRGELPRDGIVVTDSGLHQVLIRRHFTVLSPRGLILPTDFQSMGFGLPAAVGAQLAAPDRKVVAVVGDGGLAMSGMELSTLVRERLPVTVIVFADGMLNLIRLQQEKDFGESHAVALLNPDIPSLGGAFGVGCSRLDSNVREKLGAALRATGPTLVELPLEDSPAIRSARRSAKMKSLARSALGDALVDRTKRLLGRD